MKGLVLKDFLILIKQLKFQLGIILLMVLFMVLFTAAGSGAASAFPALAYVITAMLPITLFELDESYKWSLTMLAMPYTKSMYVTAKYIVGIILILSCTALFFSALCVKQLINPPPFILAECVSASAMSASMALLIQGLVLPFIFRLGVEKGRVVYLVFIAIFVAIPVIASKADVDIVVPYIRASHSVLFFVLSAVLYVLSWLLSKALYEKREIV